MSYVQGPFDRIHGLLVWGGTLPGGEQWSNSLRCALTEAGGYGGTNNLPDSQMEDYLDHYSSVIQAHHAHGGAMISNRCYLTHVKFNRIGLTGHYEDAVSRERTFAPIAGGVSGNNHPNQVALVVTLTTAVTRGPANKGRLYTPLPAVGVGTDGLISAGDADNLKDRYRSLIEDLSDVVGLDDWTTPNVCIMSRKSGAPNCRRVTGLRIGRALDTQRRRRRSLNETYVLNEVDEGTF